MLFKQQTSPSETAAVLIEPVLGEGGYVPLPDGFLRQVQDFCTANDVLLISDEVSLVASAQLATARQLGAGAHHLQQPAPR